VAAPTSGQGRAQQRIVQAGGRRYSLKLEPAFWTALSDAAETRGIRLGRLVADLSMTLPPQGNLASHLRVFCLAETQHAIAAAEQARRRGELSGGATDVDTLVEHCPAPCLVMTLDGRILRTNEGFARWYGPAAAGLAGKSFDHFFKLRAAKPFEAVVRNFAAGEAAAVKAHLLYVVPGRVVAAPVRLVPVARRAPNDFALLLMVAVPAGAASA
jgi:predicted DNA-binding ribbon-helix-helix protein